jgi:hypothetical protein
MIDDRYKTALARLAAIAYASHIRQETIPGTLVGYAMTSAGLSNKECEEIAMMSTEFMKDVMSSATLWSKACDS